MAQQPKLDRWTRLRLLGGAAAGPLFVVTVLIQDVARRGFDPRIHLMSQLSLGDIGWIQIANFVVAGALNVLYAGGLRNATRRSRSGAVAALLIGVFGAWLILVGVFRTDPANGFPPGAATPAQPSGAAIVHALGALFIFLSLTGSLAALAIHFLRRQRPGLGWYCLASSLLVLAIFVIAMSTPAITAPTLQVAVLIGWTAPSLVALQILTAALPTLDLT